MNVLLTSIGRRNYLVDYFREALAGEGQVLAANSDGRTVGMAAADRRFVVPELCDPSYVDVVLDICVNQDVGLVIPLLDLDVLVLSRAHERFTQIGAVLAASPTDVVETCVDKWRTHLLADRIGMSSPKTFLDLGEAKAAIAGRQLAFPVVVKPRWGIGSIGITVTGNMRDLDTDYAMARACAERAYFSTMATTDPEHAVLIQEMITGTEYGLDVFNDLSGSFLTCLVKEKLDMRAGETDRAKTVRNARLEGIGQHIAESLRHVANLDVDIIVRDGTPHLLELNPRFGGHYPFSHLAGANLPAVLVGLAKKRDPDPGWLRFTPGVLSAKGIQMVVVS